MILSVIIPYYNVKPILCKRCMESLANAPDEVELIIVNDGSDDEHSAELEKILIDYPGAVLVTVENGGVPYARNIGIEHASGKYLMFVDPDDYIDESFFDDIIPLLTSEEYDMVLWELLYSTPDAEPAGKERKERRVHEMDADEKKKLIKALFVSDRQVFTKYTSGPYCKAIKREILQENNIRFNEKLKRSEDVWFHLHFLSKAQKLLKVDKPYYYYVVYSTSTLHSCNPNILSVIKTVVEEIKNAVDEVSCLFEKEWGISSEDFYKYYYSFVITTFRVYMHSFIMHPGCDITYSEKIKKIKEFCKENFFEEAMKKTNGEFLNKKDKVIRVLIKCRLYSLLYFMYKTATRLFSEIKYE